MFEKRKEPIRFGRVEAEPETKKQPAVQKVQAENGGNNVPGGSSAINVVFHQDERRSDKFKPRRSSLLSVSLRGTGHILSWLWRVFLDLAGLAFVVAVLGLVTGILQAAGVIHLAQLVPLGNFLLNHFSTTMGR